MNIFLERHKQYLGRKINIETDIRNIVATNRMLVEAVADLFYKTQHKEKCRLLSNIDEKKMLYFV